MKTRAQNYIKRRFAAILSLLLLALLPARGPALTVTPVSAEELPEAKVQGLTLSWRETLSPAPNSVFTALWSDSETGENYEMCVVGLPRALTEQETLLLIASWQAGYAAELSDPALTDAEKETNKLSALCGDWVIPRETEGWGDSLKCWAASASDMLWLTGWAQQAVNPDTGAPFKSEDEVFSYIGARMFNDGSWQPDCIRWFFSGQDENGVLPLLTSGPFPVLISADAGEYLQSSLSHSPDIPPEFSETVTPRDFAALLRGLSRGAAGGMNVAAVGTAYPLLPGSPYENETAEYDNVTGRYIITRCEVGLEADDPSMERSLYTFNADGTARAVVETEAGYADENGEPVDEMWVLDGYIHRDAASGICVAAQKEQNFDAWSWFLPIAVDEKWIDVAGARHSYITGHSHALTLTGYIINLSRNEAAAVFIADSDNSAEYFRMEGVPCREDRPDTYRLCPIVCHVNEWDETCLEVVGYLPGRDTVLNDITVLFPPEGERR